MERAGNESVFIAGAWREPGDELIDVFDSTDGSVMGRVVAGSSQDVDDAVAAAFAAFDTWSTTDPADRGAACERIAAGLRDRADELADLLTRETGMPRRISRPIQVDVPIDSFVRAASYAREYEYERSVGNSLVVHEAVGVAAAITPWNYPMNQIAAKVAPGLAAGCTMVLKPSSIAPLDAILLTEVIEAAQLPDGVFNLVTGAGSTVGEALARHPDVATVSFTGSTRAGKRIATLASETLKRVTLELGGKSANILLDDLDDESFEAAVRSGVAACFLNSGQTCTALTRMLVPRRRLAETERVVTDEVQTRYEPGQPFTKGVRLGPLASEAQVRTVTDYVKTGITEDAKLLIGGSELPNGIGGGFFVQPTVFSEVRNDMRIAREEIFGPVLSILPYQDDDDAIDIANDSPYGLAGAVWGADESRAEAVAKRLRTGRIDVNGGAFNPEAPFGGYKQSGYGRENGVFGFEEYLEVKSLQRR